MTPPPQDLADRLEKAIKALVAASLQILHHDGRDGDDVDVYERAQLRKAFTPILASLRRSAPASGEIITLDWGYQYRNHVSNGEWQTTGFNDGEGSPKSRAEALAGLEKRSKSWIALSEFRLIETSSVVVSDVICIPSGETREEAGK